MEEQKAARCECGDYLGAIDAWAVEHGYQQPNGCDNPNHGWDVKVGRYLQSTGSEGQDWFHEQH